MLQPYSIYLTSLLLIALFICVIIYLMTSNYSRSVTVKGFLVPEKGIIKVFPSRDGVIDKIYVIEGEKVQEGTPIASIINKQSLDSGEDLTASIRKELTRRIELLNLKMSLDSAIINKKEDSLREQIYNKEKLIISVSKQIVLSEEKFEIKKNQYI